MCPSISARRTRFIYRYTTSSLVFFFLLAKCLSLFWQTHSVLFIVEPETAPLILILRCNTGCNLLRWLYKCTKYHWYSLLKLLWFFSNQFSTSINKSHNNNNRKKPFFLLGCQRSQNLVDICFQFVFVERRPKSCFSSFLQNAAKM